MNPVLVILSIFLSIFSTAVMSYISIATPIGPWIAPTLVLCAMVLFRLFRPSYFSAEPLTLVTVSGSIGGILATAIGFSFPTLYFLDQQLFTSWVSSPLFFMAMVGGLSFSAGLLGLWIASLLEKKLIIEESLSFPIGQMVYKMISAGKQLRKALELIIGFFTTLFFCFMQDGARLFTPLIPRGVSIVPATRLGFFNIPALAIDLWPMLWAIGYITGFSIVLPLLVGALTKIILLDPLHMFAFAKLEGKEVVFAFCSGMVVSGAVLSFLDLPKSIMQSIKNFTGKGMSSSTFALSEYKQHTLEGIAALVCCILFLSLLGFSFLSQIYLIIGSLICAYQIAVIAGKIGLAQLGRFATFVMVPALFLFNLTSAQIVVIASFVEICGGVATDVLVGRKIGQLAQLSHRKIRLYQYLGLLVASLSIGLIIWLLVTHFQLGSPELIAQRAFARHSLINLAHFDYWVLLIGCLYGLLLKFIKINPMLVLGGLLMPINMTIGLVIGGMLTLLTKDKENYFPFWSGVFAGNSIWMLLKTIL